MDQLAIVYDALLAGLSSLPGIAYCGPLPARRDAVRMPAIFVELAELEPGPDPGTGELQLVSHWQARVLLSDSQSDVAQWALVQAVMRWLYDNAWPPLNIGRAQLKGAAPDHFTPEFQGHRLWLVEWTQTVRVGDNVWSGNGVVPDTVLVGSAGDAPVELESDHDGP